MDLVNVAYRFCPYCGERLGRRGQNCSHCGRDLSLALREKRPAFPGTFWGFEYRSERMILGMPLIHIAQGFNPETGLPRVARGFIAIGGFAVGIFVVGGFGAGLFVFSGIGLGLLAIGGIAIGGVAFGGLALGLVFAVGGLAISMGYAFGALPIVPSSEWSIELVTCMREFLSRFLR
jgi:hypothetical protein